MEKIKREKIKRSHKITKHNLSKAEYNRLEENFSKAFMKKMHEILILGIENENHDEEECEKIEEENDNSKIDTLIHDAPSNTL